MKQMLCILLTLLITTSSFVFGDSEEINQVYSKQITEKRGILERFSNESVYEEWNITFGGSNVDVGHSVQQTTDGGYIIVGYTRSYGDTSGRNIWLIKTDGSGNELWNNTFGGNDDDEGESVQQTTDGGYIITGYTKSFGAGLKDVILIKTDASGAQEWMKTFGGANDEEGYSVLQTTDGGYIITGWTFSYGPGYVGNLWLVKTNALGYEEWNNYFGGTGADRGYSVQQTTDGGYIIAGYTDSFGAGLYDALLLKTNASGTQEWMKTFGGSGRDYGHDVQQTTDGGYIVVGYTLSYGAGSDDTWVIRTDGYGIELYNHTYGGTSSDVAYGVQQTADGGYIVVGHTLSYGAGIHDVWLIKIAELSDEPLEIQNIKAFPLVQATPGWVNISCHVTSPSNLSNVTLNVTNPDDSLVNQSMNHSTGTHMYYVNTSYSHIGIYDCYIWASTDDEQIVSGVFYFYIGADYIDIPLFPGWNLLTIPAQMGWWASDLSSNLTASTSISRWDAVNQTYRTYIVGGPSSFDFPLMNGCGYFVDMDQPETLIVHGPPIDTVAIPLKIGWNLLGWYHGVDTTASSLSGNISGSTSLSRWDAVNQTYRTYIVGGPSSFDFPIHRGMGLFVDVSVESVWYGEG